MLKIKSLFKYLFQVPVSVTVELFGGTDKKKFARSLSTSSDPCCSKTTTAPTRTDKAAKVDATVIADLLGKHLSSGDNFSELVSRITHELRRVIEEAILALLTLWRPERQNLRIFGVEKMGESTDHIVVDLWWAELGVDLPASTIFRSHRVSGRPKPRPHGKKRYRPIIIRVVSYHDTFAEQEPAEGHGHHSTKTKTALLQIIDDIRLAMDTRQVMLESSGLALSPAGLVADINTTCEILSGEMFYVSLRTAAVVAYLLVLCVIFSP
ncbi:hypothetical protein J6590_098130 [Homalodisca vitripennis]|nr:hypothetical protein J6590_098130 [Homalodisca vitripennis]